MAVTIHHEISDATFKTVN